MTDSSTENASNDVLNGAGAPPKEEEVEDWDKTREAPASTSLGRSGGRSLAQLMKLHAEQGKDISLTADEEERLEAELGKWINADPNPYEAPEAPTDATE